MKSTANRRSAVMAALILLVAIPLLSEAQVRVRRGGVRAARWYGAGVGVRAYGYGGYGYGYRSGVSFGDEFLVRTYTEGTLSIDLFDARSNQAIWHGSVSQPVGISDSTQTIIDAAVAALLGNFPPATDDRMVMAGP